MLSWRVASISRHLAWLVLLASISGCTVALEPAYDERIVAELETLSAGTIALFAGPPSRFTVAGFPARQESYQELASRAATIKLFARARPAPSGRIAEFFQGLLPRGEPTAGAEGDAYGNATVGYMEDYLRNLESLIERDRETFASLASEVASFEAAEQAYLKAARAYADAYAAWLLGNGPRPPQLRAAPTPPTAAISENFVERRRVALMDVLLDALVYEREILNRTR